MKTPKDSSVGKHKKHKEEGQDLTLKFVKREQIAHNCQELFFETEPFTWGPGQWLLYDIDHPDVDERGTTRKFTISTTPSEGLVGLACRFYEDGSSFKKTLLQLQPGESVEAEGPFGSFIMPGDLDGAVLVAGGIGIVPYKPMLSDWADQGAKIPIHLIYANRGTDFPYKQLLDALAAEHPNLRVDYIDTSNSPMLSADKIMEIAQEELNRSNHLYVAGPKIMSKDLKHQFEKSYSHISASYIESLITPWT